MNVYAQIVKENLPRLINMINLDLESDKLGYADRQYWGWKTIDFPNGTYQGIAHTFAIAIRLDLMDKHQGLKLIDLVVRAIPKIAHKNGAVEEAFPRENSFCVTALVAFDVLSAVLRLNEQLDEKTKKEYLDIIKPLIQFITDNDESHAIISNHLATGVAAVALWNHLSGEKNHRDSALLNVILKHQSTEGWYTEYEGPDPGYQTLCTYYLSAAQEVMQDVALEKSISKSLDFLHYFIHPNKTIGGLYGSRNTEVYYPGGITFCTRFSDTSIDIEQYMIDGLKPELHITPQTIDRENLIPLINSYAFAAFHYEEKSSDQQLPCFTSFEKEFPLAGITIHSNKSYYAILNYKKGGTLKVMDKTSNAVDCEDGGLMFKDGKRKASTQVFDNSITFTDNELTSKLYWLQEGYPSLFQFGLIRIFALTIFKSRFLRESFKKAVVRLLITGKKPLHKIEITRQFDFAEDKIIMNETIKGAGMHWGISHPGKFKSIHMASSGYTTPTLLNNTPNNLVEFVVKHG